MAIFLLVLAVPLVVGQNCNPGEEPFNDGCKECGVGFYSRDGMKCKKCSDCHHTQYELRKCSPTEDTFCTCPEDTYFVPKNLVCSQCRNCEKGTFQVVACTHNFDRTCQRCPEGQTSNGTNTKLCWVESNAHDVVSKKETKVVWPYLYGGIGAFFLLLCLILAFFMYQKRRRFIKICGNEGNVEEELSLHTFNDDSRFISGAPPFNNSMASSSSSSTVPLHIRDVPASVYFELGKKLNPAVGNNWKTLAGRLGFDFQFIGNLNLSPKTATEDLLHHWSTLEDSTVQKLHMELNLMKRPDAAEELKQYIYIVV